MIRRMPTHVGDDTVASCVVAGDYIFLAHHAAHWFGSDIVEQTRAVFESMQNTLASVGASLNDVVQLNLYLRNIADFRQAADVFREFFTEGAPARMTTTTDFVDATCLVQMDGVAYIGA
ncbi:MAG: RidA family protein [Propionibacteriaceae bacterium]|nr:RidA family protein [Propionibacteriaceae bacterium]